MLPAWRFAPGMTARSQPALETEAERLANVWLTPRVEAELLMGQGVAVSRESLVLGHMDDAPPAAFSAFLAGRLACEPVAYITGTRDFWTIALHITPDV